MLTEKEVKFIHRWENVRDKESRMASKLIRGLPMAMVFTVPILISIAFVYAFSPQWYTKISSKLNSGTITILVALLLIVLFFSYMRMHFKWEMNEQLYKEMKAKEKASDAAN